MSANGVGERTQADRLTVHRKAADFTDDTASQISGFQMLSQRGAEILRRSLPADEAERTLLGTKN